MDHPGDSSVDVRVDEDTVWVAGDVDARAEAEFRRALIQAAGTRTLDLTGVPYLDSDGVALLFEFAPVGLLLRVRDGTALAKVLDISGLARLATVRIEPA